MSAIQRWREILTEPALGDHIVQVYQDRKFLAEAVSEYLGIGLERGEAGIVIARPEHRADFESGLAGRGIDVEGAKQSGQLRFFEAQATLDQFMVDGKPDWNSFHAVVGGAIAELKLQYPAVRAYGEMVDVLWQRGERGAAIRLEELWNELGKLQTYSLFCAYYMDNLDPKAYRGPLECVCKVHTHLIPTRDYERFDEAVADASREVLDAPLSNMMLSLAAGSHTGTKMPLGQAALLWLQQNMPKTAEKVLAGVRARS
jgi:hypothetical protein